MMRKKIKKKQVWIYENLIAKAKELEEHIHELQKEGKLLEYPMNITSGELMNIALAVGLKELESRIGKSVYTVQEKQEHPPVKEEDSEFVRKLIGGL